MLETKLSKFHFCVTIFAHSATPIDEVCLEPFVTNLQTWGEKHLCAGTTKWILILLYTKPLC